jgi:hypothetical protein
VSAIVARVATQNGGKYVRQLCRHWSHKLETRVEGETGTVTFPTAVATMAADEAAIVVSITGEDRADLERLTGVVASHLDRFAFREAPLAFDWAWRD